jgi:hypothetical protein
VGLTAAGVVDVAAVVVELVTADVTGTVVVGLTVVEAAVVEVVVVVLGAVVEVVEVPQPIMTNASRSIMETIIIYFLFITSSFNFRLEV